MTTSIPTPRFTRQRTAVRSAWLYGLLWLLGVGCASGLPPAPEMSAPAAGSVAVRLIFGDASDLDLYVTDPHQETVYYANNPAHSGGALDEDVRCDGAVPRVETVVYREPLPGRYRVGVDHPERCGVSRAPVPFQVEIRAGSLHRVVRDEIPWGHFRMTVVEFEIRPELFAAPRP